MQQSIKANVYHCDTAKAEIKKIYWEAKKWAEKESIAVSFIFKNTNYITKDANS